MLKSFHPLCRQWFEREIGEPTEVQLRAWRAIAGGGNTLISAPTGSGKTLAAFLSAISDLAARSERGELADRLEVLYVSPLKALSNDIHHHLQQPTSAVSAALPGAEPIRCAVRTGDTPAAARRAMLRRPPHMLATTPESLYLLLTAASGREMLASTRILILDELHALAGNKRGAHLALSMQRLEALVGRPLQRIGLSATQEPLERAGAFLAGCDDSGRARPVQIVAGERCRRSEIRLLLPSSPLGAVMANEVWEEQYDRIAELALANRTTLVFVPTRRMAERMARHLAERLDRDSPDGGEGVVAAHHGSMARELRLDVERRLRSGALRLVVATSALELGIDIGQVDLVCQVGSPHGVNTLLQRSGRSGRHPGAVARCRLLPLSRDDLRECVALIRAVRDERLDQLRVPPGPDDVLCQQVIAEVAAAGGESGQEATALGDLFALFRRAWPYRELSEVRFRQLVKMAAEGFAPGQRRDGALLHLDEVNDRVRPRRAARLTALVNGGVIPDQFDCDVLLEPAGDRIGTVSEDFAAESLPGDVFQLGNQSYRILKVESGRVRVADAQGQPPTLPFWFGEGPGRSAELSAAICELNRGFEREYRGARRSGLNPGAAAAECADWLRAEYLAEEDGGDAAGQPEIADGELRGRLPGEDGGDAAGQLARYLAACCETCGLLPTDEQVIFERFYDGAGDAHLVIHSPFGSRINRAWGLALRKKFCRKFNFELQAAALEDCILISLSAVHSFALEEPARYLSGNSLAEVFEQALLDVPVFVNRWRWCASNALALRRRQGDRRTPAPIQRARAEDLLAQIFPDQLACQENLSGDRVIPDHPLVRQTIADCGGEFMDLQGLQAVIDRLERGEIGVQTCDLPAPSPMAEEVLLARPYAFIDDAPAEERRSLAVQTEPDADLLQQAASRVLSQQAIDRACADCRPPLRSAEELHDALLVAGFVPRQRLLNWAEAAGVEVSTLDGWLDSLEGEGRVVRAALGGGQASDGDSPRLDREGVRSAAGEAQALVAAEHWPAVRGLRDSGGDGALVDLMRGYVQLAGMLTLSELQADFAALASAGSVQSALLALEAEGLMTRLKWQGEELWSERGLLVRAHGYSLRDRRERVRPVSLAAYTSFLLRWQGLSGEDRPQGVQALEAVLAGLDGFEAAAGALEEEILGFRMADYDPQWLDQLCLSGNASWGRLGAAGDRSPTLNGNTPLALMARDSADLWRRAAAAFAGRAPALSRRAVRLRSVLEDKGALFYDQLVQASALLPSQLEEALRELVAAGAVTADSFAPVRALMSAVQRQRLGRRGHRLKDLPGRWQSLVRGGEADWQSGDEEAVALMLLRRYGVLFRALAARERGCLPPWRLLLAALRRLEARGQVRGGRFVEGVFGEQFALAEVASALGRAEKEQQAVCVSACDPANLTGLGDGVRIPAVPGHRVLYRRGRAVAALLARGQVRSLDGGALSAEEEQLLRSGPGERPRVPLRRRTAPAPRTAGRNRSGRAARRAQPWWMG